LQVMSKFKKVIEFKEQVEKYKTMPTPYGIEHDMGAFQGSSIMAIYVQTVIRCITERLIFVKREARECETCIYRVISFWRSL
ncbi:hypothetical protein WCN65_13730, partial [Staphylococcus aureus]